MSLICWNVQLCMIIHKIVTCTHIFRSSDSFPERLWSNRVAASVRWRLPSSPSFSNTPRTRPLENKKQTTCSGSLRLVLHYMNGRQRANRLTTTHFSAVLVSLWTRKSPKMISPHHRLCGSPQQKHCHQICNSNYLMKSSRGRMHVVKKFIRTPSHISHVISSRQGLVRCCHLAVDIWKRTGFWLIFGLLRNIF